MVNLDAFGKLKEQSDDLLSKRFIASTLFGVTIKANQEQGLSLANKHKLKRGESENDSNTMNTEFHADYKHEKLNTSVDISTDTSNFKFKADTKPNDKIQVKAECEFEPKEGSNEEGKTFKWSGKGMLSGEYTHESARVKLSAVSEPAIKL